MQGSAQIVRDIIPFADNRHVYASIGPLLLPKRIIMSQFGKLSMEQIEQLLHSQVLGRIGCHVDGKTYVVPISYAYDNNYVYCHTFEGMKMKMLRQNPMVCFQIDEMKNMADWKSVVAWGEFEELKETNERNHALQFLLTRSLPVISSITTHLGKQWPFPPEDVKEIPGIFFRIRITEKTGRFEKSGYSPSLPG